MAKHLNKNRSVASKEPAGEHALCTSDADCAALGRRLKLEDQSGSPGGKASKGDAKKLADYRKRRGSSEAGRHEQLEKEGR